MIKTAMTITTTNKKTLTQFKMQYNLKTSFDGFGGNGTMYQSQRNNFYKNMGSEKVPKAESKAKIPFSR